MLIRRLILENYGLFGGRHEFDLVPRAKSGELAPIILFGGKNGAGKTTILESIRLALYGRLSLGSRVRSIDYDAFLRGRVHRDKVNAKKLTSAMVAIEFDHVHRGTRDRYLVERSWQTGGSVVAEKLSVLRNDKQLDEIDGEFWQGFVRDIIPEGLSQLFFFDGEKIRELAEDATGAGVLADSIKSLLGLDLVERLDADLTMYTTREAVKVGSEEDKSGFKQLTTAIDALKTAIIACEEELASNRTHQDGVQGEIRRAEEVLRQEGEGLANRRVRLQSETVLVSTKIAAIEQSLREQCEAVFPLSLCPKTSAKLEMQLAKENKDSYEPHLRSALVKTKSELLKAVTSSTPKLDRISARSVQTIVEAVFAKQLNAKNEPAKGHSLHKLSEGDGRKLAGWLNEAKNSRSTVSTLCNELTKLRGRLVLAEKGLAQIPSDAAVKPYVEALTELNRRLGGLEQARTEVEGRLKALRFEMDSKERAQRNLAERYSGNAETGKRIETARSVQAALGDYLKRLTELKVQHLRETVVRCFNRLSRKGDVIKRIEIDPVTFGVTLFDRQDNAVPKEELSSGEKQIFAIAMLWGLAQTSGRPLPIIIDTPLGRLDSEHRKNLIEEYFPHASHQVILLSTDTEVEQKLFEQLSPSVSHSYQLVYKNDAAKTEVADGYFWGRMAHV